jgi:hypothetical protein
VDLGYVRRETPFGEPEKSTRRTLYKIADPFLLFHFRFVQPNKSHLEVGGVPAVAARISTQLSLHVSAVWEELARASVPSSGIGGYQWGPARRWWGTGNDDRTAEVDVVAESLDGTSVLVGEAKWSTAAVNVDAARDRLLSIARNSAWARGRDVVPVLWVKRGPRRSNVLIQTPDDVLDCLTR